MDDLISRSELIEEMKKTETEYENAMMYPSWWSAFNIISKQPTTYDIDKVVNELYEERTKILLSNDYECEIINYCLDNFDKAIEIVKAGGKNE